MGIITLICNKCGRSTIEIEDTDFTSFIPCCTMPFPQRTSGICGGEYIKRVRLTRDMTVGRQVPKEELNKNGSKKIIP